MMLTTRERDHLAGLDYTLIDQLRDYGVASPVAIARHDGAIVFIHRAPIDAGIVQFSRRDVAEARRNAGEWMRERGVNGPFRLEVLSSDSDHVVHVQDVA